MLSTLQFRGQLIPNFKLLGPFPIIVHDHSMVARKLGRTSMNIHLYIHDSPQLHICLAKRKWSVLWRAKQQTIDSARVNGVPGEIPNRRRKVGRRRRGPRWPRFSSGQGEEEDGNVDSGANIFLDQRHVQRLGWISIWFGGRSHLTIRWVEMTQRLPTYGRNWFSDLFNSDEELYQIDPNSRVSSSLQLNATGKVHGFGLKLLHCDWPF